MTGDKLTEKVILELLRQKHVHPGNGGSGRYVFMTHVRSDSGFSTMRYDRETGHVWRLRTFDAVAMSLWQSEGHLIDIFEVKTSRSDWLRELSDPTKTATAVETADRFWVVAPVGAVKREELDPDWGWIEVKGDGTEESPWKLRTLRRAKDVPHGGALHRGLVISMLRSIPGAVPT